MSPADRPRGDDRGGRAGRAASAAAAEAQAVAELLSAVERDPSAFDFFALLRRLDALRPGEPRTGEALRPRQEALRLGQAPELDFAPAPLHALFPRGAGAPRLWVRFFGLLGPHGPMPLHITEFVRDRLKHHDDATVAHFLDIFHHRMLTLFYRAWAQAQPVVHLDRPASDRFRVWLAALAGTPADSGALPAAALVYHGGWFTGRSRHPEMLVKVLRQYFGVAAAVEEHIGHWLPIDAADGSRLGFARNRAERASHPGAALGLDANAGSRVWDRQHRFRVRLGPLTMTQYDAFLPGGSAWTPLVHWVRLLAGREFSWDLQLVLAQAERPPPRLGRHARLGVTSWLAPPRRTPTPPSVEPGLRLRPASSFLAARAARAAAGATGAAVHGTRL